MVEKEPNPDELAEADEDVEAHGVNDEDEGEAGVLDVNSGCG